MKSNVNFTIITDMLALIPIVVLEKAVLGEIHLVVVFQEAQEALISEMEVITLAVHVEVLKSTRKNYLKPFLEAALVDKEVQDVEQIYKCMFA